MEHVNVHTPERLAGESQAQYKARRQESHAINKAARVISGPKVARAKLKNSAGAFGRGLRNWITKKQAAAQAGKHGQRLGRVAA